MKIEEKDRRVYIRKVINVYEAVNPRSKKKTLRDSEKDFLVECIWLDVNNIPIGSTGAREHLEEKLGLKSGSIYTLRYILKKKGWLKQDKYGYHYPFGLGGNKLSLKIVLNDD